MFMWVKIILVKCVVGISTKLKVLKRLLAQVPIHLQYQRSQHVAPPLKDFEDSKKFPPRPDY